MSAYLAEYPPSAAIVGDVGGGQQKNIEGDDARQSDQRRFHSLEYRNHADPGIDGRRTTATDGDGSRGDNRYSAYTPDYRAGNSNYPPSTYDQRYTVTQPPPQPPIRSPYQQSANRYDARSGYDVRAGGGGAPAPTVDPRWRPYPDQSSSYRGDPNLYRVETAGPSYGQPSAPTPQPTKTTEIYDDDYKGDYEYESDLKPTSAVREQIPPTMPPPSRSRQTPYPFVDNIPCSAYTDAVCFQQQQRNGVGNIHHCCHKGIYLSDACVANNCGNETYQLCCFQKFVQVNAWFKRRLQQ